MFRKESCQFWLLSIIRCAQGTPYGTSREKFDTSVNDIARYNGISDVNQIYPGQVLRIATQFPVASKWYIVRQGDTLSSIADRYNTTVERLLQLNCCIYDPNRIYPGQVLRVKP